MISFIENSAVDYGGAISTANPTKIHITDAIFSLNKTESGGAVGLISTSLATAEFLRCRFESNKGTRGGGLFLDGDGQRFLHGSLCRLNVAGETTSRGISSVRPSWLNDVSSPQKC